MSEDGQHHVGGMTYQGVVGLATRLKVIPGRANSDTTIAWYLLEGPWHPVWGQFLLFCVHLREMEGAPPPILRFPGATHEVVVLALNPEHGPYTAKGLETGEQPAYRLEPIDWVEQFEATDAEMDELLGLLAQGAADGMLNPSTDDARERLREHWLRSATRTLAHMRGEEHAP